MKANAAGRGATTRGLATIVEDVACPDHHHDLRARREIVDIGEDRSKASSQERGWTMWCHGGKLKDAKRPEPER